MQVAKVGRTRVPSLQTKCGNNLLACALVCHKSLQMSDPPDGDSHTLAPCDMFSRSYDILK